MHDHREAKNIARKQGHLGKGCGMMQAALHAALEGLANLQPQNLLQAATTAHFEPLKRVGELIWVRRGRVGLVVPCSRKEGPDGDVDRAGKEVVDHLLQLGASLAKIGALEDRHNELSEEQGGCPEECTALISSRETPKWSSTRRSTPKISKAFGRGCMTQDQREQLERGRRRRTWKDDPAPTAALKTSATVSRTRSSIASIRSAPSFSPLC